MNQDTFIEEKLKEFEKEMKEPDIKNSGSNSPKMWMFEGYVAGKKEAKDFLHTALTQQKKQIREEIVRELLYSLPLRSDWDDDEKVTFEKGVSAMREVLESYLIENTKE